MEKEAGILGLYPSFFRGRRLREHFMQPDPWPEGTEGRPAPPTRKWCRQQARACPGGLDYGVPQLLGGPRAPDRKGSGRRGQRARDPGSGWKLAAPDPGVSAPECLAIGRPHTGRRDPGVGRRGARPPPARPPPASPPPLGCSPDPSITAAPAAASRRVRPGGRSTPLVT